MVTFSSSEAIHPPEENECAKHLDNKNDLTKFGIHETLWKRKLTAAPSSLKFFACVRTYTHTRAWTDSFISPRYKEKLAVIYGGEDKKS